MQICGYIPCGRGHLEYHIDEKHFVGEYVASLPVAVTNPENEVRMALQKPLGCIPLRDMAINCHNAVIIASDHTRPVPARIIMPLLLEELRSKNPTIEITILIATGCHRPPSDAELVDKFGEDIFKNEKIAIHNAFDANSITDLGKTPSGGTLAVNRLATETDLLIADGFIEPHLFAGYSGGRKSILPGIASFETIRQNHCAAFIDHPAACIGSLAGNPIHEEMTYAASRAHLAFILNVVLDDNKQIVRAFAGEPVATHEAGCSFVHDFSALDIPLSDIIITSNGGYPQDQNVNQCVKGLNFAASVTRKGGVIILAASCCDGHGDDNLYHALKDAKSTVDLLVQIRKTPREQTRKGLWQCQILCKILAERTVILTGFECPADILHDIHLLTASSIDEALEMAYDICGSDSKVSVVPNSMTVFRK